MADFVLRADGLVKRFGDRTAVDHVGFTITAGETYGLLGPNGAGKTTTINMVCGILQPDAGSVLVAGQPIRVDSTAAKATIGFVPQEIALYPDLSGRENLRFFGRLEGLTGRALEQRVDAVLEVVGLAERADDRVQDYSGGMQRRCNIAAGLLHQPALLVLDEPTAGVDPQSRNQILESIEALGAEGMAVLYTTHYMEEAERLCDRIGIMDEGRLIAEGTRRELVRSIAEASHLLLDVENLPEGTVDALRSLEVVRSVTATGSRLDIGVADASTALGAVISELDRHGVVVTGVLLREPDLEAVFLHLTGKELRG